MPQLLLKKHQILLQILSFLTLFAVLASISYIFYQQSKERLHENLFKTQNTNLGLLKYEIEPLFKSAIRDIRYISQLFRYQVLDDNALSTIFSSLMMSNEEVYDQVRLLNLEGQELLKVVKLNGQASVVLNEKLQDKSSRYYFQAAKDLNQGEVWLSPIDLNIENGVIEYPFKPTVRLIAPYSSGILVEGYIVINLDLTFLFAKLKTIEVTDDTLWVINENGHWLLGPKELEWAFMTSMGAKNNVGDLYPAYWNVISRSHQTQNAIVESTPISHQWFSFQELLKDENIFTDEDNNVYGVVNFTSQEFYLSELAKLQRHSLGIFGVLILLIFAFYIVIWKQLVARAKLIGELRHTQQRQALIFQSAPDAILICEQDGTITDVNEQCCKMFGYDHDELIGQKVEMLVPEQYRSGHINKRSAVSREAGSRNMGTGNTNFRAVCKDGSLLDVDINLNVYSEELGGQTLAIVRDISVLKNAERLTEDALNAAELSASARADFLANMSHEIRTPMNGINGMLNLLLDTPLEDRQRHFATQSKKSAEALLRIINDILDISKIDSGKLEIIEQEVDLEQVLIDVGRTLEPLAQQKDIELFCPCGITSPLHVSGDAVRLRQIVMNLVGNAIKFTHEGYVQVNVVTTRQDKKIGITLSVEDTGIGMAPEFVGKIFERFTQADSTSTRSLGGTGLGLAIITELVRLLDGHVEVESTLGVGTIFKVHLTFKLLEKQNYQHSQSYNINLKTYKTSIKQHEIISDFAASWHFSCGKIRSIDELAQPIIENTILLIDIANIKQTDLEALSNYRKQLKGIIFLQSSNIDVNNQISDIASKTLIKPLAPSELFNAIHYLSEGITRNEIDSKQKGKINLQSLSGKVLLVDDDIINLEVASYLLEKFGVEVICAKDGKEAINQLSQTDFDLILMDCQMPIMDGYTATRQIREGAAGENNRDIIIIALTANALRGDQDICIESGMNDYLSKPIEPPVLHEKLMMHLG